MKRQLAMKDINSHSWVTMVRKVLHKYKLPSAYTLIDKQRLKAQWKRQTQVAVKTYWNDQLNKEAQKMF